MSKSPTIGFFTTAIYDNVRLAVWQGVADAAQKYGYHLACVTGGRLRQDRNYRAQGNILYEMVSAQEFDGLISWASNLGEDIEYEETVAFHQRYQIPFVSLTLPIEGAHTVSVDSAHGMREAMCHLIEAHGCRKIAFIRGPENHPEAQKRYQAYLSVLEKFGILPEQRLISPPCPWRAEMGTEAIRYFLDAQHLEPAKDIEAIASASDLLALPALHALLDRKLRVPDDIAIIGFNDITPCQFSTPPLTSVVMPFYEQGFRGMEVLHALLEGHEIAEHILLPTHLEIRQSCGCLSAAVREVTSPPVDRLPEAQRMKFSLFPRKTTLSHRVASCRRQMLDDIETYTRQEKTYQTGSSAELSTHMPMLLDRFLAEIQGLEAEGSFVRQLTRSISDMTLHGISLNTWQGIISILRTYLLPLCRKREHVLNAQNICEQARIAIGEMAQQHYDSQHFQARQYNQTFNAIKQMLITTFNVEELLAIITREFPQLGISSCALILYENSQSPLESFRLMMAYTRQGPLSIEPGGKRIPPDRLVPKELYSDRKMLSVLVMPLYFQEEQIGFLVFEDTAKKDVTLYNILRTQLSIALRGALLVQERQWGEKVLERTLQSLKEKAAIVSFKSRQISERVQHVSNSTEQFARHIQEISNDVMDVMQIVKQAVAMAEQAKTTIFELQNRSGEIGNILKIIDLIAQQTNMLALNATIEAARAGDAGRGFGVVAKEIKALAQQTAESAEDIARRIRMMQSGSEDATEAIGRIVSVIDQISAISQNIESAMSQQSENSDEIVRMIAESACDNEDIALAIAEVADTARGSTEQVEQLKRENSRSAFTEHLKEFVEKIQV